MKLTLLKLDEVADFIDQAERSGNILQQEQTSQEVIYHIQSGTSKQLLINIP